MGRENGTTTVVRFDQIIHSTWFAEEASAEFSAEKLSPKEFSKADLCKMQTKRTCVVQICALDFVLRSAISF